MPLNRVAIPSLSGEFLHAIALTFRRGWWCRAVTGLSQHAVKRDVAAKILCDNLQALTVAAARATKNRKSRPKIGKIGVRSQK